MQLQVNYKNSNWLQQPYAHLGPCQTSKMELFCKNSLPLSANYFHKNALP